MGPEQDLPEFVFLGDRLLPVFIQEKLLWARPPSSGSLLVDSFLLLFAPRPFMPPRWGKDLTIILFTDWWITLESAFSASQPPILSNLPLNSLNI